MGVWTLERQEEWYAHAARNEGNAAFTVYETASWAPIGRASLQDIDHRNRSAELAMLIGEPGHRGKGYGTEAARLLLDYAFTALGLHSVWLIVFGWNEAALQAYRKAGFRECGRRREAWSMGGRYWDLIEMDCLSSEFNSPVLRELFIPEEPTRQPSSVSPT